MSWIDRRLAGRPLRSVTALARFQAARQDMNLAFVDWLSSAPDLEEVSLEVDGTVSALSQLVLLTRGGAP